jgi:hypothetical protein
MDRISGRIRRASMAICALPGNDKRLALMVLLYLFAAGRTLSRLLVSQVSYLRQ